MAFVQDSFIAYRAGAAIKAAGARTCRLWHYATTDDWATVSAAGYFNGARAHIGVGDIVRISGDLDGTPFFRTIMFATVPASGNVTWTEISTANATQQKVFVPARVVTLVGTNTYYAVAPIAGAVTKIRSVIQGVLTTGDATLTAKIGATPITSGVITITQAGSAAGDIDVATPSAANVVAAGDLLALTVGGTNATATAADVLFEITPS